MCSVVTIHYRFHPLHGRELSVERMAERGDGFADCIAPDGRPLRVPLWMTRPEAAVHDLADSVRIDPAALLKLSRLLDSRRRAQ